MVKVLCVAEKPSIAKAVAGHLAGGHVESVGHIPFPVYFSSSCMLTLYQAKCTRDRVRQKLCFSLQLPDLGPV